MNADSSTTDILLDSMPDLRKAILAEMGRKKWSVYKLVQELKGKRPGGEDVPSVTVYEFINNERTINLADLGLICDALGLELRRKKN